MVLLAVPSTLRVGRSGLGVRDADGFPSSSEIFRMAETGLRMTER
jgi:hypothetical protein